MKKMAMIIVALLSLFVLFYCSTDDYSNWNRVYVSDVGSFMIPQGWIYHEDNDVISISSSVGKMEEGRISIIGNKYNNNPLELLSNADNYRIEYIKTISSEGFSNSAIVGIARHEINGNICENVFIDMYSSNKSIYLIVLEEAISNDIVKSIAKSFNMHIKN